MVLQRGAHILSTETESVANELSESLLSEGIAIHVNAKIHSVSYKQSIFHVKVSVDGKDVQLQATHLLVATGRKANRYVLRTISIDL